MQRVYIVLLEKWRNLKRWMIMSEKRWMSRLLVQSVLICLVNLLIMWFKKKMQRQFGNFIEIRVSICDAKLWLISYTWRNSHMVYRWREIHICMYTSTNLTCWIHSCSTSEWRLINKIMRYICWHRFSFRMIIWLLYYCIRKKL
jgi:hypothetical protein